MFYWITCTTFILFYYHQIPKNSPPAPPCELNSVTDEEKREAPSLYKVISIVAKKCPNYLRWQDAVSEFITLTTYARPEPHQSKTKVLIPLLYGWNIADMALTRFTGISEILVNYEFWTLKKIKKFIILRVNIFLCIFLINFFLFSF